MMRLYRYTGSNNCTYVSEGQQMANYIWSSLQCDATDSCWPSCQFGHISQLTCLPGRETGSADYR